MPKQSSSPELPPGPADASLTTPAPRKATLSSIYLRLLLLEIEHSGSSSYEFWRLFWSAECDLSDTDVERLAWAVGSGKRGPLRFATMLREERMRSGQMQP